MVNSADFTKRLEKILDFYGLSATAFSEEIDFNRSTISHLLSGRNKPSLEFVMKVVQKFEEVNLYWLLNGKGTFPSESNNEVIVNKETPPILSEKKKLETPLDKTPNASEANKIEKIIIFYKDGSFKAYEN
ncbi:helix-turn-helix transcriptional regulator [Jejudonia soesokkakensis]|uniref:Helix-turn-helix transcriptional regulator n=1 Tax=Jejudonia soesokkakensis TaxID=1323432 RepID=A0ABW2MUD1_9FLAO